MGYFILNKGLLQNFQIKIAKNEAGANNIFLTIYTDIGIVKYRIWNDIRHPDLNVIYNDLLNELNYVKNNPNAIFEIDEYPERMYIFITYSSGESKQYSAVRETV